MENFKIVSTWRALALPLALALTWRALAQRALARRALTRWALTQWALTQWALTRRALTWQALARRFITKFPTDPSTFRFV